ncbi:MAG: glycoside hydrolase family 31 protein [Ruminococcaceae bacterium]|nr:glycoside hydrolase family 31 protein [Oscillospiraceae bacterium]
MGKDNFWNVADTIRTEKNAFVTQLRPLENALYFQLASGIVTRLTYEGVRGWRLQANAESDLEFTHLGASQALSKFMGEEYSACPEAITFSISADVACARSANGTCAVLGIEKDFSLKIISASGEVKCEVCDIYTGNGSLSMCGVLEADEAVFGGGERFDVVNKRGTKAELYSCDGWNNTSTTYAPIPLFFTSRGGGMFINLYDTAFIDFGKEIADRWSYTVKRDVMDCYFYASDDPSAVLLGYTELSGHAYMPTPWMQGMHICRYGPDFQCFDRDFSYDSFTEFEHWRDLYIFKDNLYVPIGEASRDDAMAASCFYVSKEDGRYELAYVKDDAGKYYKKGPKNSPGGNSVKTIMGNFIGADLKPDAASMENFAWYRAFDDRNPNPENKRTLADTVKWLHDHGLHSMFYTACGRVVMEHKGFKEEYLVHADVTFKNADGTVTKHENTTLIPWVVGTGENPDVWRAGDGRYRAEKYLDITNEEALEWYFDQIWGEMIDIGVDGVKIDFCEEMPDHGRPCGTGVTHYRWKDPSKIAVGAEHHAYPAFFISAFYKRMFEHKKRKRLSDGFMVFSRGGGIGSQRSPYMWAGDQARKHEKLKDQLLAVVNSGLSGIPFMSFDMAGYQYWGESYYTIGREYESAIFARAVEFTAMTTNMQTHGDVRHAYEMTEEVQQIYRNFTRLHAELIPYIQKYSRIACETGMPPVRHPVLKYIKDSAVYGLNDEFMLGDGLLVAPILTKDTFKREVYLPAGEWTELLTGRVIEGGKTVTASANLGQIPVYLDNFSPDREELLPVFAGIIWDEIKNWK